MSKKKKMSSSYNLPADWVVSDEIKVNGRIMAKGVEFSIVGESGRFVFTRHVKTSKTEWIDCVGGSKGHKMMRSFAVDRVKRVHYKNKTIENVIKERKEQKKLENAESESAE